MNKNFILPTFLLIIVFLLITTVVKYNQFIDLEEQAVAINNDSKNIYTKITNNMKTQTGITEKYSEDILKSIEIALSGRYGKDGAKGAMSWVQEQNPTMSSDMYKQLSVIVDSGYSEFANIQTRKNDVLRVLDSNLRKFPGNIVAKIFGFPTKDLEKLRLIIINEATEKAFETGKSEAIDLFKK